MNSKKFFKGIRWQDFESLCLEYVKVKYKTTLKKLDKELVHINSNIGQGNTGIDAVVYYSHPQFDKEIWFEFKRHSRSIGLEVIGKYAVILVSRAVGKFVLLSASNVTKSALGEFSDFMYKSNIEAEIIFGDYLLDEFRSKLPLDTQHRFNIQNLEAASVTPVINLLFFDGNLFSQVYSSTTQQSDYAEIRRDDVFYLVVTIYNPLYDSLIFRHENEQRISEQLESSTPFLKVKFVGSRTQFSHRIKKHQCLTFKFACYSTRPVSEILLPNLEVLVEVNENVQKLSTKLPNLKVIRPNKTSLIGKENITFLSSAFSLIKTLSKPKPFLLLIQGLSGTGKTRLLEEILIKAKIQGVSVYQQDGEIDISLNFIRKLLSDCLNLQFGRFNVQYAKDYILALCSKHGIPEYHGHNIHEFLINNNESDEILYSVVELIGFSLSRSPFESRCIAIDNIQEFNTAAIHIIEKLIDFIYSEDVALSLVLIFNNEKVAHEQKKTSAFIKKISHQVAKAPGFFIKHTCEDLTQDDANYFMREKLPDLSSQYISRLIESIGSRPLDLEICSSYLDETRLKEPDLRYNDSNLVFNSNKRIPKKIRDIYQARIDHLITNNENRESIMTLMSWILLMNYGLPCEFVSAIEFGNTAVNTLIDKRVIKYSSNGTKLSFYHHKMAEFISTFNLITATAMQSSEPLNDLLLKGKNLLSELEYEYARFNIKYYVEPSSNKLISQAKLVIDLLEESGHHAHSMAICEKVLRSVSQISKENAQDLFFLKSTRAFLEMEFFNLKNGVAQLLDCEKDLIKWKSFLTNELKKDFFITLINGLLHSSLDSIALEKMENVSHYFENPDSDLVFNITNRKCVAYMHLNKIELALKEAQKAIVIAKEFDDPFYLSKAYSDMGYSLLNSIDKTPTNLTNAIESYREAIKIHGNVLDSPPSRDIEIANQHALMYLLQGDYALASSRSKEGLEICIQRHYMYLYPRICVLGSVAELQLGNLTAASEYLNDAYAVSAEYDHPKQWKISNNMAVIEALNGRFEKALDRFLTINEDFKKSVTHEFAFLKEQTVMRNIIYLSVFTGTNLNSILTDELQNKELWNYANLCKNALNKSGGINIIQPGKTWRNLDQVGLEGIFV